MIDQEQDNPSFPHWKKGIHPSDEMIRNSIDKAELYVLADGDEIVACVIANDEKRSMAIRQWESDLRALHREQPGGTKDHSGRKSNKGKRKGIRELAARNRRYQGKS